MSTVTGPPKRDTLTVENGRCGDSSDDDEVSVDKSSKFRGLPSLESFDGVKDEGKQTKNVSNQLQTK